jgi:adenylate kinase
LRTEMCEGSEIGKRATEYVEAGELVPDEVISGIMLAAVDKLPPEVGFILDGFPRTPPQAEVLDAGLADRNMALDGVIDFELSDEVVIHRIAGRRVCGNCGATYNVEFLPPRVEGVCDVCGAAAVVQRKDDKPEVVGHRLETYRAQTEPLISYYRGRGKLIAIDAAGSADEVEERVLDAVRKLSAA